jgi:hypothetical protein
VEHSDEVITLAGNCSINSTKITKLITVTTPTHKLKARFRVLPLSASDSNKQVLLGQDLLPLLGIAVTGLPTEFYSEDTGPTDLDDVAYDYTYAKEGSTLSEAEVELRQYVHDRVKEAFEENLAIPKSKACNIPESIIRINTGNALPRYMHQYRILQINIPHVDEQVGKWIADIIIVKAPPGTLWNSPLLCVPKKDSTGARTLIRVCIDPRAINEITVADKFPLPIIKHVLDALAGYKVFSTLDLAQGYHQFLIAEEDRIKTAFTYRGEVWMFARGPFGLKNLPAIFQRVMHRLFHDLPNVFVFIDDIICASNSYEEHITLLHEVLRRLTAANLRVKKEKCILAVPSLGVLGHIVGVEGVRPDPVKVQMALNWDQPRSLKQLQSFLGLVN